MKNTNKFYFLLFLTCATLLLLLIFIFECCNRATFHQDNVEFFNFSNKFQTKFANERLERYFRLHESLSNASSTRKRMVFNGNENGILNGKFTTQIFDAYGLL